MRRAFTLIELLVVVAIIALLISILLPALSEAKQTTRTRMCQSNMRQLTTGFTLYATEWNGMLPGSTWDYVQNGSGAVTYENSRPYCWLGSLNGSGDREHMPFNGTIFDLVGRNEKVFKCPQDALRERYVDGGKELEKPFYSYTAPPLLSGAPLSLLRRTRWPGEFVDWDNQHDWDKADQYSLPWMIVEENLRKHLAFVVDSAWSNIDRLALRHGGETCIGHFDGSASVRTYQPDLDAW
ncbi:prepilin-type N-terminal cleavage/methylation domain-containing protein [bacterium]|nr:prepilin-type N-terminal cleavage/methylation domain-containing protein [bacterium]